ncbi:hypothetical protein BX666DRAFT_2032457 [Dichotomocladium elegans]|nr:hypothetical protein BX666DRAFT_2032457 [Dichotomocladium elegans]
MLLNQQHVYMTGGSADKIEVWRLDLSDGLNTSCPNWQLPAFTSPLPSTDSTNDTQSIVSVQPYLYGVAFPGPNQTIYIQAGDLGTPDMDNMVVYAITTGSWRQAYVDTNSPLPQSRAEMSAVANETTQVAWYYGGRSTVAGQQAGEQNYYNDFYSFDMITSTWSWPQVRYAWGQRPARYGHKSVLVKGQLFILGGKTAIRNATEGDWIMRSADFESVLIFDTIKNQAVTMATIGDIPNGRLDFSAALASDGKSIVIFGGKVANTTEFIATQDVYVLDTCSLSWSTPNVTGTAPAARAGHESVSYGDYILMMMGYNGETTFVNDVGVLNTATWEWVNHIPAQVDVGTAPEFLCRFTFPHMPGNDTGGDDDPTSDPKVISNSSSGFSTGDIVGVALGVIGFLLLTGAGLFFFLRYRRHANRPRNPRWLPRKKDSRPCSETALATHGLPQD